MIGSLLSRMDAAENLSPQQLQQAIKDGTIPAYVGIPLLQDKIAQQKAAQSSQAAQQPQQQPIAQQVMQAADQVTRPEVPPTPTPSATDRQRPAPSLGLEAARSNMPEEYAGGGIVAFANTGLVTNPDDVTPGPTAKEKLKAAGLTWQTVCEQVNYPALKGGA